MNKEELRHLSSDCEYFLNGNGRGEINLHNFVENLRTTYIEPKEKHISKLEKTINKLREQLSLRYSLEDKITELKLKLEALEGQTPWKDIKDKSELIKENTILKEESKKSFNDWLNACDKYGKVNLKLTKAKEIIQSFLRWHTGEDRGSSRSSDLVEQAEQFIKDNFCPDCSCEDCTKEDCEARQIGLVEKVK